jgi:8-oxo-dGTP diphosphatase
VIALATGIALKDGRLLMVASRYPNQPNSLWNLPGGRQQFGELLAETVVREVYEETGLHAQAREVAYISESYDGERHFLNVTFVLSFDTESFETRAPQDDIPAAPAQHDAIREDHVERVEWVPVDEVERRIAVAVVREPLVAYLRGSLARRYAGFHEAGITIEWPENST